MLLTGAQGLAVQRDHTVLRSNRRTDTDTDRHPPLGREREREGSHSPTEQLENTHRQSSSTGERERDHTVLRSNWRTDTDSHPPLGRERERERERDHTVLWSNRTGEGRSPRVR